MAAASTVCVIRRCGNFQLPGEKPTPTAPEDYVSVLEAFQSRAPQAQILMFSLDTPANVRLPDEVVGSMVGSATAADWADPAERWKGATAKYTEFFEQVLVPRLQVLGVAPRLRDRQASGAIA